MIDERTEAQVSINRHGKVTTKEAARAAVEQFLGDIDRAFDLVDASSEDLMVYLSISTIKRDRLRL